LFPFKLGDFARWREEFPIPSAVRGAMICASRANFELSYYEEFRSVPLRTPASP